VVSGDFNSPSLFAYSSYNSLAHGNYVTISGNESFKDVIGKLSIQRASVAILNQQEITKEYGSAKPVEESAAKLLKNIFVPSEINPQDIKHLFGGKEPKHLSA